MKDIIFDQFQNSVNECLLRNRSILDIITKLEESQGRVNRAVIKSATNCGCIKISTTESADTLTDLDNIVIEYLNTCFDSNIKDTLCTNCREVIQQELGDHLFYIASLCNTLDLNMYDILLNELKGLNTLGKFSLK
ncbi:MAG: DUF1573 domain-containing protein [Clostridium sp.]